MLFDLDGTLVDTAPDLAAALNRVRLEEGSEALPFETIRPWVSHGGGALIRFGFPEADEPRRATLTERLLDHYAAAIAEESRLFPGLEGVLARLEAAGRPWGVVTNKPERFTFALMAALGLDRRAACLVSGDTTAHSKPHPAPMHHACALAGCDPATTVYVGDAERDIAAGRAAGMVTLVAEWGYLGPEDDPAGWGADHRLATPVDLGHWLERPAPPAARSTGAAVTTTGPSPEERP